jgi:hypothetical protein
LSEQQDRPKNFTIVWYEDLQDTPIITLQGVLGILGEEEISSSLLVQAISYSGSHKRKHIGLPDYVSQQSISTVIENEESNKYLTPEDLDYVNMVIEEMGFHFPYNVSRGLPN